VLNSLQSEKFALSDISATSPEERINISVSFSDRQKLNTLEDQVLNLRTMLQSSLQTIASLKTHCVTIVSSQAEFYEQQSILNIFDEASSQASSYLTKVDVLRRLVKSATTLLTDILTYDNASILKLLAEEARIDNVAMIQLSKQAAEDSRAIRVITIITVVFLPATVVSVSTRPNGPISCADQFRVFSQPNLFILSLTAFDCPVQRGFTSLSRLY
jgi:hypothetical protein